MKSSSYDAEHSREESSTGKPFCGRTLRCVLVTLVLLLYGAVLLTLVLKNYYPWSSPSSPSPPPPPPDSWVNSAPDDPLKRKDCSELLEPISGNAFMELLFSGRWVLQEAYSSDYIDQFALTKARSSWAEFTREPGGTIYLHMAHMLRGPNMTINCVYHHFRNITVCDDALHLTLPQWNASAKFQFLKACNECLVLTAKAMVPHYSPLDYLLAYGLHPDLNEYFLRPTREQAACKKLKPPAPFKYRGADFCPKDEADDRSDRTQEMDLKSILFPRWTS